MTKPQSYWLKLTLLSDTTFGRGDGVAGLVDAEVRHDRYGLPYLGGKTLKGLLGAACAEVLSALEKSEVSDLPDWQEAAAFLFGVPGSGLEHAGKLKVGDEFIHESIIGSQFIGRVEAETTVGGYPAIVPSIQGWAKITGYNRIIIDDEDEPYAVGFQVVR